MLKRIYTSDNEVIEIHLYSVLFCIYYKRRYKAPLSQISIINI